MKSDQKKEIEAKWQRLLNTPRKSRKSGPVKTSTIVPGGSRVIRRRKARQPSGIA